MDHGTTLRDRGPGRERAGTDRYEAAAGEALEGIAARFGDGMAASAARILTDPRFRWAHGLLPWPWSARAVSGRTGALQDVVDAWSPEIDRGTLRSLTRLWDVMTGMDDDPADATAGIVKIRMRRCLSLIMAAGLTDRRPAGHASADTYAAAAVIHGVDTAARPVRTPGVGVGDVIALIEDVRRAYGWDWTSGHAAAVHARLAALTVLRHDGADAGELTAVIDAATRYWYAPLCAVMDDGRRTRIGDVRTVLAFHGRTGAGGRTLTKTLGWNGYMDDMVVRRGHSGRTMAAMAAAAMRLEDGNAADPLTGPGAAAMGRAVALMSEASRRPAVRGLGGACRVAAMDALDVILTDAAEQAAADPDAMDMIMSIARFRATLDHDHPGETAGPLLRAGDPGLEALADGVRMRAEGLPEGFAAQTALAALQAMGAGPAPARRGPRRSR